MVLKFTLLFTLFISFANLFAQLSVINTDFSIHFFNKQNNKPILSIPTETYDFFEYGQQELNIDEKLGSYKLNSSRIYKSKKPKLSKIEQVNDSIIKLHFSNTYKRKLEETTIKFHLKKITNGEVVVITIDSQLPNSVNYCTLNLIEPSKAIFGGGIQFSHTNLKGQQFDLIVEENGVGRGDKGSTFLAKLVGAAGNKHTTYTPLPYFLSSNKTAYQLKNNNKGIWSIDFSKSDIVKFKSNFLTEVDFKNDFTVIINSLDTITNNYSSYENTPQLKDWMYHYILGVQGGKTKVNQLLKNLQNNNITVGAIWIQDWVGKRQTSIGSRLQWDWRPNETYYPNITQWIDSLQNENIKVLGYINPYFVEGGLQTEEGIKNSYFVKNEKGEAYKFKAGGFNAYMLDLSSEKSRNWAKDIIQQNLLATGFDGWMCDFGEWLPFTGITLANPDALSHNEFPKQWTQLNYTATKEYINKHVSGKTLDDYFIFNRAWYSESYEMPRIMWLGDQMGNFGEHDGLASAVNAYNSASLSNIPIIHSDIGGYTAIKLGPFSYLRNDETLERWIEMEAFTPLWRSHEGLKPEKMSQIYQSKEMMQFFAYFDSIHKELIPYFKNVNQELIDKGLPLVRHPFIHFPSDDEVLNMQYQFMVGSQLMVCPITKEGAESVQVYLPKGKWKHFFTNEEFKGEKYYNIKVPTKQPAVFWLEE